MVSFFLTNSRILKKKSQRASSRPFFFFLFNTYIRFAFYSSIRNKSILLNWLLMEREFKEYFQCNHSDTFFEKFSSTALIAE